ncbi:unnamed protein product [Moneuplotes crassus]|uniref:Uncharacterized protein n=2 Tax=Euplotes crassus TaxID=5936 RepID=A0AAD2D8G9_EUPCR|nr:unnamed protein product [Moneuplotes crassus]
MASSFESSEQSLNVIGVLTDKPFLPFETDGEVKSDNHTVLHIIDQQNMIEGLYLDCIIINGLAIGDEIDIIFERLNSSRNHSECKANQDPLNNSMAAKDMLIDKLFGNSYAVSIGDGKDGVPYRTNEPKHSESVKDFTPSLTQRDMSIQNVAEFLKTIIKRITVLGFPFTQMPAGTNMIKMLNISSIFKNYGYVDEYYNSLFLSGLTMVSARKYIQSVEFFRNIQSNIFNKILNVPDDIFKKEKSQEETKQEAQSDHVSGNHPFKATRITPEPQSQNRTLSDAQVRKSLKTAAKLEILIADCCSQHSQLREKLSAFKNATILYKIKSLEEFKQSLALLSPSQAAKTQPSLSYLQEEDIYACLSQLQPHLLSFILSNLNDGNAPIRIAFLKSLEFLIDTLGPSLGQPLQHSHPKTLMAVTELEPLTATMKNTYNHFLESFLSVLSSLSTASLLVLYNEVLVPRLGRLGEVTADVCIYLLKMGDKVIERCQGDVPFKLEFVDMVFDKVWNRDSSALGLAIREFWSKMVRQVFGRYGDKRMKQVGDWIMQRIKKCKEASEEHEKMEADELTSIFELVGVLVKERKSPEYWNSDTRRFGNYYDSLKQRGSIDNLVIRRCPKGDLNLGLYSLVKPVLFWCDYSIEKESRINLFKPAWKALVKLFESLPVNTNDELIPIILPYLSRIHEFSMKSSPTLSMLKFINLIINPINSNLPSYYDRPSKMQSKLNAFLLSFLVNFVRWVPHNLNEEAFKVLETLLVTLRFSLRYEHIEAVTLALLDKYTMRSKIHKEIMSFFISLLLEQDSGDEANDFQPERQSYTQAFVKIIISGHDSLLSLPQEHGKDNVDFLEKVGLINSLINDMDDRHIGLFDSIVRNKALQNFLCLMVHSGVTSICLKALEIVQNFTQYYVQVCVTKYNEPEVQQSADDEQADFEIVTLSHTRLFLAQMIVKICFLSAEKYQNTNAYIEFSTLSLLSMLYESVMPAPSFANEIYKAQNIEMYSKKVRQNEIPDLREVDPALLPQYEIIDPEYLAMRLDLSFKLWDYIRAGLDSQWTNIQKLAYRLFGRILHIDFHNYNNELKRKFKKQVPTLLNLLLEKENTEANKGCLYILGSFCGFGFDCYCSGLDVRESILFFRRNQSYIPKTLWQKVFDINDWDDNVQDAANILMQFCAPRESLKYFTQMRNEQYELKLSELQNELSVSRSCRPVEDIQSKEDPEETEDVSHKDQSNTDILSPSSSSGNNSFRDETEMEFNEKYFYIDKYNNHQIKDLIKLFLAKVLTDSKESEESMKQLPSSVIFSLPSKLWIDKQGISDKENEDNDETFEEDKLTDFIEDTIDATDEDILKDPQSTVFPYASKFVQSKKDINDKLKKQEESGYLIYERHFESQPFAQDEEDKDIEIEVPEESSSKEINFDEDLNTEDLGIIDIEDDDVFDDDKLPFLKNTYSKKYRPNNSKSVAAGSKSKANRIDFGREDIGPDSSPRLKENTSTVVSASNSSNIKEDQNTEQPSLLSEESKMAPKSELEQEADEVVFQEEQEPPSDPQEEEKATTESKAPSESPKEVQNPTSHLSDPTPPSNSSDSSPPPTNDDPEVTKSQSESKVMQDLKSIEIDSETSEGEEEEDIDKYLDYNDEGESDDEFTFKKFPEKIENVEVSISPPEDKNLELIDDFDICVEKQIEEDKKENKEKDIKEVKENVKQRRKKRPEAKKDHHKIPASKITKNPDIKEALSKSLEESKTTPRQFISKKKVTSYKPRTKNVNICISNPDISIKTSYPQINTSKIHSSKLCSKKPLSSKPPPFSQPHSSPKNPPSKPPANPPL